MLFNRSAIVPSLAVSPNDARTAEAGTVYVTWRRAERKTTLAASATTTRRTTSASAAPCFAFTTNPLHIHDAHVRVACKHLVRANVFSVDHRRTGRQLDADIQDVAGRCPLVFECTGRSGALSRLRRPRSAVYTCTSRFRSCWQTH